MLTELEGDKLALGDNEGDTLIEGDKLALPLELALTL